MWVCLSAELQKINAFLHYDLNGLEMDQIGAIFTITHPTQFIWLPKVVTMLKMRPEFRVNRLIDLDLAPEMTYISGRA